jgi:hypothetical protein
LRNYSPLFAFILALVSLSMAALDQHFQSHARPTEDKRSLSEVAAAATKRILKEKVLKEESPKPVKAASSGLRLASVGVGLLSFALAAISWVRKEHARLSGTAAAIAILGICWEWVLVGVGIAFLFLILSAFLS